MNDLFVTRTFTMHSGDIGHWKIECDALSVEELKTLALMLHEILPPFGNVYGIPRGGVLLAEFMRNYSTEGPRLVVDDVLTTGNSMINEMSGDDLGAVLFSRGLCPPNIVSLFQIKLKEDK